MERVEQYRQSIRQVLTSHATFESSNSGIESQLVFDTKHDHETQEQKNPDYTWVDSYLQL